MTRAPIFRQIEQILPGVWNLAGTIPHMDAILDKWEAAQDDKPPAIPAGHLTPHFTLAEMTRSETASRKGIPNMPGSAETAALKLLCETILEPARAHFGSPVIVTSGYRSPRLNTAIGGSASSQHCKGEAADFTVAGQSNIAVCRWIRDSLKFDQLIYEFGESGWVHCSFSATRTRKDAKSAVKRSGRTVYLPGIVA